MILSKDWTEVHKQSHDLGVSCVQVLQVMVEVGVNNTVTDTRGKGCGDAFRYISAQNIVNEETNIPPLDLSLFAMSRSSLLS